MTHFNVQDYKGQLLGIALTIGVGGLVIPNNTIKTAVVASMSGLSIGSLVAYKVSQSSTNYQLNKYIQNNELKLKNEDNRLGEVSKQLSEANNERLKLKSELTQKQSDFNVLSALNTSNVNKIKELSKLTTEHEYLKQQVNAFTNELTRANQDLVTVRINLINKLTEHLENTTRWIIKQIETKLKLDDYKTIHVQLADLLDYVNTKYDNHLNLMVRINDSVNFAEMMGVALQIMDESTGLKVRYNKTLNIDNIKALEAYMNNEGQLVSKNKATQAMTMLKQKLDANYSGTLDKIRANDENLDNLWGNVQDLIGQIDTRNLEIDKLKHQIYLLSQPQKWTLATSNRILDVGNKIIDFFYTNTQIILDRSHSESDEYQAKLYFQIDRNSRGILPKELNEHSEALQQFCRLLNPVEFSYDANKALILAEITLKVRSKIKPIEKLTEDINKIWITADKFEQFVKNFERVRITAGSTGGKSPTAKNLALAIMKTRNGKGELKLYDPQHGSKKDYWNMPKSGTSHDDNLKGMRELCELIDSRRHGSNHSFVLYIFDEVDNTVTTLKKGAEFKDLIKVTLKEGSHANTGAIYIGQSCDVTEVPGMTHSNWNNAVQIHIGSNAGLFIERMSTITSEEKTRLLEQYRKIQEYCDTKNQELGLDIFTDATAYRFALVIPLTGLPKFIQLPDFDSYDYNQVMSQSKSEIKTEVDAIHAAVKCPHCRSENVKKNGKSSKGEQYYTCQDCKNTPRKWIN